MKKYLAAAALSLISLPASAMLFDGTYDVSVNSSDPGLVVTATPEHGDLLFNLNVGQTTSWLPLFQITTSEHTVNGDDLAPLAASITFDFLLPSAATGTSTGTTAGMSLFYGLFQWGTLSWANGGLSSLYFADGGILDVYLHDTIFAAGVGGLSGAEGTVNARFGYRRAGSAVAVPEPGAVALLGIGFIAIGLLRLRSRRAVPASR